MRIAAHRATRQRTRSPRSGARWNLGLPSSRRIFTLRATRNSSRSTTRLLERTTNGHGSIHDSTLAELRKLDAGKWYDREFAEERIPTLEEVLDFSRDNDVVFYLEVKYDVAWGMHHTLVAAIRKAENAARTIVISLDPSTIAAVRRVDPSIMVGLLADDTDQAARPDLVKAAQRAGRDSFAFNRRYLLAN